jgi:phenylpyruvate tautomerase PptA (4-oxalocrotonate tautomerase family)
MPLYTSITPEGMLSAKQKQLIAEQVTKLHSEVMGAPPSFVRIIFQTYPAGDGFTAAKEGKLAVLSGQVRMGRSKETKTKMITSLWTLYEKATGASKDQMLVFLADVPATQTMEMGAILPEPGHEAEWLAVHG